MEHKKHTQLSADCLDYFKREKKNVAFKILPPRCWRNSPSEAELEMHTRM